MQAHFVRPETMARQPRPVGLSPNSLALRAAVLSQVLIATSCSLRLSRPVSASSVLNSFPDRRSKLAPQHLDTVVLHRPEAVLEGLRLGVHLRLNI